MNQKQAGKSAQGHQILDHHATLSLCVKATLFNNQNRIKNSEQDEEEKEEQKLLDQMQVFLSPDYIMLVPSKHDKIVVPGSADLNDQDSKMHSVAQ